MGPNMDFSRIKNEDLYKMCQRGDDEAWGYLFYYVRKIAISAKKIASSSKWNQRLSPEDIAQITVGHLAQERVLDSVREPEKFRGFVAAVAYNKFKDTFQKMEHPTESLDSSVGGKDGPIKEHPSSTPNPEEIMAKKNAALTLRNIIASLDGNCKTTLPVYLDYLAGRFPDQESAADHMGLPLGTYSSRITRCLKKLSKRKDIRELFFPEPQTQE